MINNLKHIHTAGSQMSKLAVIAAALKIKDPYTQDHARRVAIYAGHLAKRIGLPRSEVKNVMLGGLLHGFGQMYHFFMGL